MPLDPMAFKDQLKADLEGIMDADAAATVLGATCSNYILTNALFNFAWVAVDPSSVPDPITVTTGAFTVLQFSLSPSGATTVDDAKQFMQDMFIAGMNAAMYNITASGWTTAPAAMSSAPQVPSLDLSMNGEIDRDAALLTFATNLINWVVSLLPVAPCAGSHGTFIGQGTVTSIV